MSASRRLPMSRFQPGMAAMKACTGASPSALAICGLPPDRSFTVSAFSVSALLGLAGGLRGLLARDVLLVFFELLSLIVRLFSSCHRIIFVLANIASRH